MPDKACYLGQENTVKTPKGDVGYTSKFWLAPYGTIYTNSELMKLTSLRSYVNLAQGDRLRIFADAIATAEISKNEMTKVGGSYPNSEKVVIEESDSGLMITYENLTRTKAAALRSYNGSTMDLIRVTDKDDLILEKVTDLTSKGSGVNITVTGILGQTLEAREAVKMELSYEDSTNLNTSVISPKCQTDLSEKYLPNQQDGITPVEFENISAPAGLVSIVLDAIKYYPPNSPISVLTDETDYLITTVADETTFIVATAISVVGNTYTLTVPTLDVSTAHYIYLKAQPDLSLDDYETYTKYEFTTPAA